MGDRDKESKEAIGSKEHGRVILKEDKSGVNPVKARPLPDPGKEE